MRKVLVIGGGISGKGAEHALKKCGADVTVADENEAPDIITDEFVGGFESVIISPSVTSRHKIYGICDKLNIELYGEIELGFRLFGGTVVAVTGTNGKTTTAALICRILNDAGVKASVCGNIGVSFADVAVFEKPDVAVVEVSSFQLESVKKFRADIAIITNISVDHLDRHKSFREYCRLKHKIAQNQTPDDILILSADSIPVNALNGFSPNSSVLYTSIRSRVLGAYLNNGVFVRNGVYGYAVFKLIPEP
jgi:UDP-N-acetylmuramoylalanine--D-glutamate ligase